MVVLPTWVSRVALCRNHLTYSHALQRVAAIDMLARMVSGPGAAPNGAKACLLRCQVTSLALWLEICRLRGRHDFHSMNIFNNTDLITNAKRPFND